MDTEKPLQDEPHNPGPAGVQLAGEIEQLGLEPGVIAALGPALASARMVTYPAGTTLYNEGAEVEALYVIRAGMVKLLSYIEDGRARIVRLHNRPAIIGLNGLLGERHEHTAVAIGDVQVYQLPLILLMSVRDEDPAAFTCLVEQWSQYLNCADTWITEFSSGPIRGRVARLLKFLAEIDSDTSPGEVTLLTGEEMGEVLGVTPESVSRVIADFKRKGILRPLNNSELLDRYRCSLKDLEQEAYR
jgi:CRP-like cAMP-binding protein